MSRGIFGIIDVNGCLENVEELTVSMESFLGRDDGCGGRLEVIRNRHYLLGMKRPGLEREWHRNRIVDDTGLGAACLINGEIHNCPELMDEFGDEGAAITGDLDLVLRLYRKHGAGFAKRLNGLFSLAIMDHRDSSFHLLSDRFGMANQVYWTTTGTRLYFATHLKTLLACPGVRKSLDSDALNLFLKYAYITSPWSIFKGIRKLQPGHILSFRDGRVEECPYWEFSPSNVTPVSSWDEAVSGYRAVLGQSIARRIGDPERTGILLSGGLDSSANVAFAAQCSDRRINTFAIGFEDPRFDERPYARMVARRFNTRHNEYTITGNEIQDLPKLLWRLEEPYFEFGLFLTYRGLAAAAPQVDAVIGGEGADQLFGTGGFAGARPAAVQYLLRRFGLMGPARAARRLMTGPFFYERDNAAFKLRLFWNRATDLNDWYFYGYDENEISLACADSTTAGVPRIFNGRDVDASSFPAFFLDTQIHQDIRHYINENVMVKTGRMADMLNLSLRESFLDKDVADFVVGLDFRFKRGGGLAAHLAGRGVSKILHRKAMEGLLPDEVLRKPKQGGFVPVMLFLRDAGLRRGIYDYLLRSKVMKEHFRKDYLQTLFSAYEEHQAKPLSWPNFLNSKANRVLFLLSFDIWHRFYMEGDPLRAQVGTLSEYLDSAAG